jgi:CBS-domain-containing membrane protein
MKVAQVMTRQVAAVRPETPLKDVAALMVSKGISGVPVVADDGAVLGVVSEADFVIKERGPEAVHHRLLARVFGESRQTRAELAKIEAQTAGAAMTSPAITVKATDTLRERSTASRSSRAHGSSGSSPAPTSFEPSSARTWSWPASYARRSSQPPPSGSSLRAFS